jgi:hypothetical protein
MLREIPGRGSESYGDEYRNHLIQGFKNSWDAALRGFDDPADPFRLANPFQGVKMDVNIMRSLPRLHELNMQMYQAVPVYVAASPQFSALVWRANACIDLEGEGVWEYR